MKRIIAVYGHARCGKSSCLNTVRELLRANGESLSSNPPYSGDRCETFRYKDQIVCVCPGGDTEEIIDNNFRYALDKNADIIITGSRTKGAPVNKVYEYAKDAGIKIKWYKKSVEYYLPKSIQNLCNEEYGKFIFGLL